MSVNTWFTSDDHIGHKLMAALRMCPSMVTRDETTDRRVVPAWFDDEWVKIHDDTLAHKWDSVVQPQDIVYVLGDTSSGTKPAVEKAMAWFDARKGRKRLFYGNHCPAHPMYRDAAKWEPLFREVFETVAPYGRRRIPLEPEGHTGLLMCHFPYEDKFTGIGREGRFEQYRLPNLGMAIAHGHTHSVEKVSYTTNCPHDCSEQHTYDRPHCLAVGTGTLQLHVGVDAWAGSLVPLSWIVEQVQAWSATTIPREA